MKDDRFSFNRAAFLAGAIAAASALPQVTRAAPFAGEGVAPDEGVARLKAGNRHFVNNEFPPLSMAAEKRELVKESQAPFAAVLSCSDSRVIPELVFIQGIGELFVCRVAGNYPDNLVTASLEYTVEHLGTRLIVVLGHQNCGAVKAVYGATETKTPLSAHLSTIESLIAPGIESVVRSRGTLGAAIEANVRAATSAIAGSQPVLAKAVGSGKIRVVGAVYKLGSGQVTFLD